MEAEDACEVDDLVGGGGPEGDLVLLAQVDVQGDLLLVPRVLRGLLKQ